MKLKVLSKVRTGRLNMKYSKNPQLTTCIFPSEPKYVHSVGSCRDGTQHRFRLFRFFNRFLFSEEKIHCS